MSPPPETCDFDIVRDKWHRRPNAATLATITEADANTWLLCRIDKWGEMGYRDEDLWEIYKEDFEGWETDTFLQANTDVVRQFRDHLREWGVYVPKEGSQIASVLANVLQETTPAEWTVSEFKKQTRYNRYFSIGMRQRAKGETNTEGQREQRFNPTINNQRTESSTFPSPRNTPLPPEQIFTVPNIHTQNNQDLPGTSGGTTNLY